MAGEGVVLVLNNLGGLCSGSRVGDVGLSGSGNLAPKEPTARADQEPSSEFRSLGIMDTDRGGKARGGDSHFGRHWFDGLGYVFLRYCPFSCSHAGTSPLEMSVLCDAAFRQLQDLGVEVPGHGSWSALLFCISGSAQLPKR